MNKLLIVVDMQNDFVTGALANDMAKAIIPAVKQKIQNYLASGYPVYFTLDSHESDYLQTEEGKNLPVPHCIGGSDGYRIVDELKDFLDAGKYRSVSMFIKDTFGSAGLFHELQTKYHCPDFDTIELIGICTDICVIANAVLVKTAQPNAHIVVDANCCAGVTKESHDTALNAMKALHVEILNQGNEAWR